MTAGMVTGWVVWRQWQKLAYSRPPVPKFSAAPPASAATGCAARESVVHIRLARQDFIFHSLEIVAREVKAGTHDGIDLVETLDARHWIGI
jgi:hypothetical protein